MNANMKKWMTVGAVVAAAAVVMMSGGNAQAKKETDIVPGGNCNHCTQQLRSGTIVCELVSCQSGCQYFCRDTGIPYEN